MKPPKAVSEYMASIGQRGGEAKGARKTRDPEHYRKMVEARRKKKRAALNQTSKQGG